MADSWNMLISEKGGPLHFHLAWTGETSSWDIFNMYFTSPIGHLGLWSPTTPSCLPWQHQTSDAGGGCWCTWKICRWQVSILHLYNLYECDSLMKMFRFDELDGSKPTVLCQHRSNELRQISSHSMRLWVHVKTRTNWSRAWLSFGIFLAEVRLASLRPGWGSSHDRSGSLLWLWFLAWRTLADTMQFPYWQKSVAVSQMLNHIFEMFRGEAVAGEYHQL